MTANAPSGESAKTTFDFLRDAFASDVFNRTSVSAVAEFYFALPERRWRSDLAWPDVRVALEIDGGTWVNGRHNRASSIFKEMEKGKWIC